MDAIDPEPYLRAFHLISNILVQPFSFQLLMLFLAMGLLLLLSALISGSEVAFFSLTPAQLKDIKSHTGRNNQKLLNLLESPKKLLATILIANNFVNVSIIVISTIITSKLFIFNDSPILTFVIQVIVVTALILLFGEILPKMFASHNALSYAHSISGFMRSLTVIFHPLSTLLINSTSFIDKRIKRKGHDVSLPNLKPQ